ncbi:hypothetical protein QUF80_06545 [Desulfococcaceae bacterium HSG8]|nr:hypothetical protein [Desulfococcaceae bacterium HSG8]
MTIAEELQMEGEIRGEIRGEIKMCRELMEKGFIPREVAEKEIAELSKKLEEITGVQIMSAGGFDAPDRVSV